jgi:signal transduction histidine kinase
MDRRLHAIALEVLPAVALATFLVLSTELDASEGIDEQPGVPGLALVAAAGLSFALHRRAPVVGYAAALAFTVTYLIGNEGGPVFLAPLATLLPVIASRPPRVWSVALVGGTGALAAATAVQEGWSPSLLAAAVIWLVPPLVFAGFMRARRDHAAIEEAEEHARVVEQRVRMARDLHDVVGHSLSTISLHAGVAERALDTRPDQVRESIAAIRQASREALDELRAVLGILRDASAAEVVPTPGLDAVPALVDAMREAGLDVELAETRTDSARVPDVVGAVAYRIVQESLTNVARHAGAAAHAEVRVATGPDAVEVEIRDDGLGAFVPPRRGTGIAGMRERAAALGGVLDTGPMLGGGFRVHARLPVRRG